MDEEKFVVCKEQKNKTKLKTNKKKITFTEKIFQNLSNKLRYVKLFLRSYRHFSKVESDTPISLNLSKKNIREFELVYG
jgi:uncharacterized protein YqfA (UPF0365 family)